MLRELINFTDSLDPEFKALGMKHKEGLHIFLEVQNDGERHWINEKMEVVFTRKKEITPEDNTLIKYSSTLTQLSWCVNTNKCFDLPIKAIHSCSPYCLALKRENLVGGEKYASNASGKKSQVYERINAYFGKASELLESEEEKQYIEIFKNALNTEERFQFWVESSGYWSELKDSDYVIFYLKEPIEKYQTTSKKYLTDKLFNTSEYNVEIGQSVFGTSDFFNGFPTKKAFLTHQSASFDISGRISAGDAKSLYEFQDIIGRNILPNPLPIFIHREELNRVDKKTLLGESISLFKKEAINGVRIKYQEIIKTLYNDFKDDFGNYYLLFYSFGEIKDFDFVSKFEYELIDREGNKWEIKDLFGVKNNRTLDNVFDLHFAVMQPAFNNSLVMKTKTGDFQYRYFDDIDSKYCKSDNTFLLVNKYRKAFYDFIYKSKRQAVTSLMFHDIMRTSILDDIRLDELKNGNHSERFSILQKLNIWFSLYEKFDLQNNKTNAESMASKLQVHREFIEKLSKGETSIESDDQYAFAVGQVIYYLLTKSKTSDTSYKRLEPFVQQVHAKELNKAIARLFDTYKHEPFSANFRNPFAEVMDYETTANMRDFMPTLLAGIFSKNALFSDKEVVSSEETKTEEQ
ncbi:hypothetical protein VB776_08305 [Arcicella sp. DC2W]|uniref:CRISPR-associated protein Csh1 n=1 Tax=Arcicella gelida TaxID=2984195 RepID=A0ABU5S334_9BACT|nr:hypothetical protein [Arcicella sp. DC2W]MEA5402913.1 hypothetical protein [Arcicella sp. DC2W]